MNITRIVHGIHTTPFRTAVAPAVGGDAAVAPFASFFKRALGTVVGTDYADKLSGVEAVAGGDIDIHSAIIDAQKAEIALNLTLQIRNKAVESYQEIMRMQV